MSVVDIDDFRPHLVIQTHDKKVHVVPVGVVIQWANGEEKPDEDCLRKIISEWLDFVTREKPDAN